MTRPSDPQGYHNFIVFKEKPQTELLGVAHGLTRTDMMVVSLEHININREVVVRVVPPAFLNFISYLKYSEV